MKQAQVLKSILQRTYQTVSTTPSGALVLTRAFPAVCIREWLRAILEFILLTMAQGAELRHVKMVELYRPIYLPGKRRCAGRSMEECLVYALRMPRLRL